MKALFTLYSLIIVLLSYRIGRIHGREKYKEEMRKKIEEIERRLNGGM